MFIKKTFKDSKNVKRIRNYVLKTIYIRVYDITKVSERFPITLDEGNLKK